MSINSTRLWALDKTKPIIQLCIYAYIPIKINSSYINIQYNVFSNQETHLSKQSTHTF